MSSTHGTGLAAPPCAAGTQSLPQSPSLGSPSWWAGQEPTAGVTLGGSRAVAAVLVTSQGQSPGPPCPARTPPAPPAAPPAPSPALVPCSEGNPRHGGDWGEPAGPFSCSSGARAGPGGQQQLHLLPCPPQPCSPCSAQVMGSGIVRKGVTAFIECS